MGNVTDSRSVNEPKDPNSCTLFAMYRAFASTSQIEAMRARYENGSIGYGEVKRELFELIKKAFSDARARGMRGCSKNELTSMRS
jgi:tryptophanyl-tRNA synthetase